MTAVTVALFVTFFAVALTVGSSGPTRGGCATNDGYCPDEVQQSVDQSFSRLSINETSIFKTDGIPELLPSAVSTLGIRSIPTGECRQVGYCRLQDATGVWHSFAGNRRWNDGNRSYEERLFPYQKHLFASDFVGRPIEALGIGMVRDQTAVIARVRRFVGEAPVSCGPNGCRIDLHPGRLRVYFANGRLQELTFDGFNPATHRRIGMELE